MQSFAVHIEGETSSANTQQLVNNFLESLRGDKAVIRTATLSAHAPTELDGKPTGQPTLEVKELTPTLGEAELFAAGHRKPAQPDPDTQTVAAGDVKPLRDVVPA